MISSPPLWLVVGAVMSAAATADDPPPPCGPDVPRHYRLIAPTEVPWRFYAGVAVVLKGDDRGTSRPASLHARIETLEGAHLRPGYAGSTLSERVGWRHYTVYPVRFLPGDTAGRVTVTYEQQPDTERPETCIQTLTADIRALPDEGVRVRIVRMRQRVRRLIVTGRLSRRARRPILVVVYALTRDEYSTELRKRVRTRGRRFRTTISLRSFENTDLPLRSLRGRGFYPGDFRDPAPL